MKAKNAQALVMVDPVLGDDPGGLYVDKSAADKLEDELTDALVGVEATCD